jgi:glucan endo-1,3-beta-D-glucosidase
MTVTSCLGTYKVSALLDPLDDFSLFTSCRPFLSVCFDSCPLATVIIMHAAKLLTLASFAAGALGAAIKGFNYGSTHSDGSAVTQQDFQNLFTTAQNLQGTSGFASARLFTMIQAGTVNTPTSAIQAAIDTKTSLLLGLWASTDQGGFNNELAALNAAISQYGQSFVDLIVGISVGSEDLYRNSPIGIINKSGVGADPSVLVTYIQEVRNVIANTIARSKPVGHVDTWTAWVNGSNVDVITNVDFVGMDAYT